MKKFLLSLLVVLSALSLIGCSSSLDTINHLTYGSYIHEAAIEIDNDTAYSKMNNENFLLATYGDTECGCWTYFSKVLDYVTKYNNLLPYKLANDQIDDRLNEFGIKNSNDPAFYIVCNGSIILRYFYADGSNIFKDEKVLYDTIKARIGLPMMYFIDEGMIKEKVTDPGGIIYYMRLTCPDCAYCTPKVIMPYLRRHYDAKGVIYVFDMDPLRNEDLEKYQTFKDEHFLSNKYNTTFGYDAGYVPTLQYYQDGQLYDMAVYFNDEITDGVITKSYYDDERSKYIHYNENLIRKTLTGTQLYVTELSKTGDWASNEIHSRYYEPFIEAFLDYYFK